MNIKSILDDNFEKRKINVATMSNNELSQKYGKSNNFSVYFIDIDYFVICVNNKVYALDTTPDPDFMLAMGIYNTDELLELLKDLNDKEKEFIKNNYKQ